LLHERGKTKNFLVYRRKYKIPTTRPKPASSHLSGLETIRRD